MKKQIKTWIATIIGIAVLAPAYAYAAPDSDFNQTISAGTLTTDIADASRNSVANPSVTMSSKAFSFNCYASGTASTGTLGTNTERLYVSNGDAADNGWTLTVAATDGAAATWQNAGATRKFDFNDPSGSPAGCADGADAGGDTFAGQMTINPAAGTLTTDCTTCTSTGVSLGTSTAYNQGTTDSVTLLNAGAGSDDTWRGYLTGASVSQTIPAEQPADTYTLNLTLTATAQ